MLDPNQNILVTKMARDIIARNNVRSDAAIRMYRSVESMPPNVLYEHKQRVDDTEALTALMASLDKITTKPRKA